MKHLISATAVFLCSVMLFSCSKPEESSNPVSQGDPMLEKVAAAGPVITNISPASAEIGDVMTITGNNFGTNKGPNSSVTIKGIDVSVYQSWSKTQIIVLVPSGAPTGSGTVIVTIGNKTCNAPFTLLPSSPITIGGLIWMGQNLDVATYRNNDPIPQVTDPAVWDQLTTGAWCYYNNDPAMGAIYGKLYNWYAINDPRGLAPDGWHIPTDQEWKTLSISLGMSPADADLPDLNTTDRGYFGTDEGGKMKEVGLSLWLSPNTGATNSSGFTALPGGMRSAMPDYDFVSLRSGAMWWTATEADPNLKSDAAWSKVVAYYTAKTYRGALSKKHGFSVRCVKNSD